MHPPTASPAQPPRQDPASTAALVRASFAAVAGQLDALARTFYSTLFALDPDTREMFPANMSDQRERFVTALVHVVGLVDDPSGTVPFLQQLGRDHRKFGVVAAHYDSVGAALLRALETQLGPVWTPEVARAWAESYRIIAGTMSGAADAEPGPTSWGATVVEHHRLRDDLAVVRLMADTPVPRAAGQYVSVQVPQRMRMWRWMSPANAPYGGPELEFHVRAVPGGWVSGSIVGHTVVGDRWLVGPAMGRLGVPRSDRRDVLMVAGGTGLAPLRAIVQEMAGRGGNPRVQLFVGGRTPDDLYDLETLMQLAASNPWLTIVPVQEHDVDPGAARAQPEGIHLAHTGTLADVVTGYGSWSDRQVLVSGSPAMVRATVSALVMRGTPSEQIDWDPLPAG